MANDAVMALSIPAWISGNFESELSECDVVTIGDEQTIEDIMETIKTNYKSNRILFDDIKNLPQQNVIIVLHESDLVIGIPKIKAKELILHPVNMNFPKHYLHTGKIKKVWLVKKIITDSFIKEETIEQRIRNIEIQLEKLK